jgi:ATP-dependent Clp protease ATP-binding subunit ClpA
MYDRFTERARAVLQRAHEEARCRRGDYVGTEHILLALAKEGDCLAAYALKTLELDPDRIDRELDRITPRPQTPHAGRLEQSPRVKQVLEYALHEAIQLGHAYVSTEHLLLALLRVKDGVAAQALMNLGQTPDAIRDCVLAIVGVDTETDAPYPAERRTPMYERFTDRARKVVQLANQEAQRANHEYIGTEHLLLGLVKEGAGVAANVLKNLLVDLPKVRAEVEKVVLPGPEP